ncbi:hypothetical protein FO519_008138 [Halicephalobus sp. NKZ332]|nr:hypothetical protein FO519_008138 [Halicephalobus sp. NKZ332]
MIHTGHRSHRNHRDYEYCNRSSAPGGKLHRSCSQMRPQRQPKSRQYVYAPSPKINGKNVSNGTVSNVATGPSGPSELTLIVMGGEKVGKSALVSQFLWNSFPEEYRPTVEEFNWIEYDIGGGDLVLQVIDTAGSRDFLAMRSLYTKTGDVFIVVFSLEDPDSFQEAKRIIQEIKTENRRSAPIFLVGNKEDKEDPKLKSEAQEFSESSNLCFFCLSAKKEEKVSKVFEDVIEKLKSNRISGGHQLRKRRQSMPTRRACSGIDIDVDEIQRIAKKHNRKDNCTIS